MYNERERPKSTDKDHVLHRVHTCHGDNMVDVIN